MPRLAVAPERHTLAVHGLEVGYLAAGSGPAVVLLHGNGETALDWEWVLPALAGTHRVYAPALPGSRGSARPAASYTPELFERVLEGFLEARGIERSVLVGNSQGGLTALRLALAQPERVAGLVLVASAGLGREISPVFLPLIWPGTGDLGVAWARTPLGALQRAWSRAALLFARPWRAPASWIAEQQRAAQLPGFLEAQLSALRAQIGPWGQREVLLEQLPHLAAPVLVVWGKHDRVVPLSQAHAAMARLRRGRLAVIPEAGHLPQVEQPALFAETVGSFLAQHQAPG